MDMISFLLGYTSGSNKGSDPALEGVHYVTFMSQDGTTELYKRMVVDGDDCADPVSRGYISAPTKESTAQYSYTHNGWATTPNGSANSNALKAVTEDKTVYAAFKAAVRYYTVTYYDSDGSTVLKTEVLAYGATPSYTPTKTGYQFDGWTPALTTVTRDASYTSAWTEINETLTGTFASGATWKLIVIGTTAQMILSGSGAMDNYAQFEGTPWEEHSGKITSISIGNNITTIGDYSFAKCTNLNEINIPGNVTKIGWNAFKGCKNVKKITLNEGLQNIGHRAFYVQTIALEVYPLAEIVIPASVTYIYSGAFSGWEISSATFKDPVGWRVNKSSMTQSTGWTTLTEENLANPATAANYLDNVHHGDYWRKD